MLESTKTPKKKKKKKKDHSWITTITITTKKDLMKWVLPSVQMERDFRQQHQSTRGFLCQEQHLKFHQNRSWSSNFGLKIASFVEKFSKIFNSKKQIRVMNKKT